VHAQPELANDAGDRWPAGVTHPGVEHPVAPQHAEPPLALQELPLPDDLPSPEGAPVDELSDEGEPPIAVDSAAEALPSGGIGNSDVLEMVAAEFSDSTIVAVIEVNPTEFDLSPRSLVSLKEAGVSERVIEAMLAAEAAKAAAAEQHEPTPAEVAEAAAAAQAAQEYARLTEMIEQLAAQQEAAAAARVPEPPASRADPSPRVWLVGPADRTAIAPTIAQVAVTGASRRGSERFKTLQGLAGHALAFANPAVSGIATTLGSLFRPDEDRTAVWALAGPTSSRVLGAQPEFEIDYAHIPGVDPDRYQPAMVQLVPTNDNYRLVAAAETDGTNAGALPNGPVIEEKVATESTKLGRGQYRVKPRAALGPGEYALVLRPVTESKRSRRRNDEASLGELLGGSTSQVLYVTWEFSVAP
jgi:hypothetical protein